MQSPKAYSCDHQVILVRGCDIISVRPLTRPVLQGHIGTPPLILLFHSHILVCSTPPKEPALCTTWTTVPLLLASGKLSGYQLVSRKKREAGNKYRRRQERKRGSSERRYDSTNPLQVEAACGPTRSEISGVPASTLLLLAAVVSPRSQLCLRL